MQPSLYFRKIGWPPHGRCLHKASSEPWKNISITNRKKRTANLCFSARMLQLKALNWVEITPGKDPTNEIRFGTFSTILSLHVKYFSLMIKSKWDRLTRHIFFRLQMLELGLENILNIASQKLQVVTAHTDTELATWVSLKLTNFSLENSKGVMAGLRRGSTLYFEGAWYKKLWQWLMDCKTLEKRPKSF